MNRARAYLFWRVFGAPLAAYIGFMFVAATIFQHVYLMPAVAEREALESLVSTIFCLVSFGALPLMLWFMGKRHRTLTGRRLSWPLRIAFGLWAGVCLVFFAGGIFVMVTILCRLAGVPV